MTAKVGCRWQDKALHHLYVERVCGLVHTLLHSFEIDVQTQCSFAGAWGGGHAPKAFYVSSYFWDRAVEAGQLCCPSAMQRQCFPLFRCARVCVRACVRACLPACLRAGVRACVLCACVRVVCALETYLLLCNIIVMMLSQLKRYRMFRACSTFIHSLQVVGFGC